MANLSLRKKIIFGSVAFLMFVAAIAPTALAGGPVNVLSKITVNEAEESGFKQALKMAGGKIISKVVGAGFAVFEIFYPTTTGDPLALKMCINGTQCVNSADDNQLWAMFSASAPASYTISWKVWGDVADINKIKCWAFDIPMRMDPGVFNINWWEGVSYEWPKSYAYNVKWKGSRGIEGTAPFADMPVGTYYYSMVCYAPKFGNWLTDALDKVSMFGEIGKKAVSTRQVDIRVNVSGGPGPGPGPGPVAPKPVPTVSASVNPSSINLGESTTFSWSSTDATSCTGSRGGSYAISGFFVHAPPSLPYQYGMKCAGPGGTSPMEYRTVTQKGVPPPPPPPPSPQCNDSADNDGDGKIDFPADPGCSSTEDNDESDAPPPVVPFIPSPSVDIKAQ